MKPHQQRPTGDYMDGDPRIMLRQESHDGESMHVKLGDVNLLDGESTGMVFLGTDDPSILHRISNATPDPEQLGMVHADMTSSDRQLHTVTTMRVRIAAYLREATDFTYEQIHDARVFIEDHKEPIEKVAKTAGVAGSIAVAVFSLYKIRPKREHE
jgi:membrane-bound lytic murein transglycosylase B